MSVEVGLKDCRSDAVPVRRQKEKKVRYRNVNAALIGTPRDVRDRNQAVWTEKNKYKMNDVNDFRSSRRDTEQQMAKRAATFRRDWQNPDDYVMGSGSPRKTKRTAMYSVHSDLDDGTVPGVTYSFDAYSGPSHGEDTFGALVEQAEIRYENKVFDRLVKTEYEMVETTSDEDSEEEFELIGRDG